MITNHLDPVKDYDEISKWIAEEAKCVTHPDDDYYELRLVSDMYVSNVTEDAVYPGWVYYRKAWMHADYRNEQYYQDHISFMVVKCMSGYYVVDKQDYDRLKKKLRKSS